MCQCRKFVIDTGSLKKTFSHADGRLSYGDQLFTVGTQRLKFGKIKINDKTFLDFGCDLNFDVNLPRCLTENGMKLECYATRKGPTQG